MRSQHAGSISEVGSHSRAAMSSDDDGSFWSNRCVSICAAPLSQMPGPVARLNRVSNATSISTYMSRGKHTW